MSANYLMGRGAGLLSNNPLIRGMLTTVCNEPVRELSKEGAEGKGELLKGRGGREGEVF